MSPMQSFTIIIIACLLITHFNSDVVSAKPATQRDVARRIEHYLSTHWNESAEEIIEDKRRFIVPSTSTMTPQKDTILESNVVLDNRAMASAPETCEPGKKMDSKRKACRVDLG